MGLFDDTKFMGNTDIGFTITQPAFDNMVLELNDYVAKIEAIPKNVEMEVYNSQEYFKGEVGDAIRSKFRDYSKQIDVMSSSLLSYSNDLLKLKQSLINNDKSVVASINDFALGLKTKAEQVNEQ